MSLRIDLDQMSIIQNFARRVPEQSRDSFYAAVTNFLKPIAKRGAVSDHNVHEACDEARKQLGIWH